MPLLKEEQVVRDTWVVERFLGEGAFAEVFRVRHRFLGRQAMKVLRAGGSRIEDVASLLAEAMILSRMPHPNVVRVFEANTVRVDGREHGFFTMEYVPGGSLDDFWRRPRKGFCPVEQSVALVKQVCTGVATAHAERPPIVHRDIKPANILIGYEPEGLRVRVSDFGLAKRVNPATLLASAQGTLSFKPPEAFANQDSPAADVWAIGTTLYLLLTDQLPYPELDARDVQDAARFVRPIRPPSLYNARMDDELNAIVAKCLLPEAKARFPDAGHVREALGAWERRAVRGPTHSAAGPYLYNVTSSATS